MQVLPEATPAGWLKPSLYLILAEPGAVGDRGRTVKPHTIETSDESVSPIEPIAGGAALINRARSFTEYPRSTNF